MTQATELERKFCKFGEDLVVTDGVQLEGYASFFGVADQSGDQVQKGAYSASLKSLAAKGRSIKMLWQHDPAQPIGVWNDVREDDKGLYVKGRLLDDVAKGREAAALIAAGAIDGLSIGYRTKKASRSETGNRVLQELELWEVSLVTFPMLPSARVAAKAEDPHLADDLSDIAALFRGAAQQIGSQR